MTDHDKLRRMWLAESGGMTGNALSYQEWLLEQLLLATLLQTHASLTPTKGAMAEKSVRANLDRGVREYEQARRDRDEDFNRES